MTNTTPPRRADDVTPLGVDCAELLQLVGLAVVGVTTQAVVTSYNPVAQAMLGWTNVSGLGLSFTDHVDEHPEASSQDTLRDELAAGRTWSGRVTVAQAGVPAARRSAPATAVPLLDDAGRVIGGVAMFLDLESALWSLLTGSLDGWLVVHQTGRISYASKQAVRLLGRTARDLTALGVESAALGRREGLGSLLAQLAGGAEGTEFQVAGPDGSSRWIEAEPTGSNHDGPVQGDLWRLRDVTDRRRLDQAEQSRADELQSALDSRVVIEQAKGFLAGRDGDTPEGAFVRLRRHARDRNLTLRDVARQLMDGEIVLPADSS